MRNAYLIISDGAYKGNRIELSSPRLLLGRGSDSDICIKENSISRHHAVFSFREGNWYIDDLGSQNGTFCNEQKITNSFLLSGNCRLRFGLINAEFEVEHSEGLTAPALSPATFTAGSGTDISARIINEFSKVIIGQHKVAEELLIALAAGGHCLMIGLPGLAKTLMASTLAQILELQFKRIQFTPDLMPSDIIGSEILDLEEHSGKKSFRFIRGPVFTNMLLADEINRTPPKTQAALLEAMQEKQVTAANQKFELPPPFFVLATQNPLEQEGTYPLPEAQLDRFMFNIMVDYPSEEEEEAIIMATTGTQSAKLQKVLSTNELLKLQAEVRELPVSEHVVKYATRMVRMTRPGNEEAPDFVKKYVHCGAGPRAAQCLILGAKAKAVLKGKVNVACSDVREMALPALRHRIFTSFTADSEGVNVDNIIKRIIKMLPEPGVKDY